MARQSLGDRWPEVRTELVELVADAGAIVDGAHHTEVHYLVTAIPSP